MKVGDRVSPKIEKGYITCWSRNGPIRIIRSSFVIGEVTYIDELNGNLMVNVRLWNGFEGEVQTNVNHWESVEAGASSD